MWKDSLWFDEYIDEIKNENISMAKQILLNNVPDNMLLYKYCRGLNRDLKNLIERKLWLSNVFRFNDPYDCAIVIDCGHKSYYPPEERKEAIEDYLRQQEANRRTSEIRNTVFVACFSDTNHSFPMWGYYAAENWGLCIGYDVRELIDKYNCFPVIYQDDFIVHKEGEKQNLWLSALSKSSEWEHEREWRIIKIDNDKRGCKGIIEEDFLRPKKVFVGCRQEESVSYNHNMRCKGREENELFADISDICDYAKKNDVELYFPIISNTKYELIDRKINDI